MKLLYFVPYFPPENTSGSFLVMNQLEAFAKAGWTVEVFTPTPTRGVSDNERRMYKNKRVEKLFDGKVIVHRIPLYREKKGFVQRTIRFCIFSVQCLFNGMCIPADAVFTGCMPPTQGIVSSILYKFTKKKVIYNPQDLFPDSLINAGFANEESVAVKVWRRIEKSSYKNADAIITISEDMRKSILSRWNEPEKVHVIRNWIDTERVQHIDKKDNRLYQELGIVEGKFIIVYAGNIGHVQGIDSVIEVAKALMSEEQIHFVIFGNGSEEIKIRQMIETYQLTNVSMYPLVSPERVSEVYSIGDVSLVSCKAGTGGAGMPSKTWTIMATGTPVLGYFDKPSEFSELLESTRSGWCVEAGKTDELAAMIVSLCNDREQCAEYGRNAREYAETHLAKSKAVKQYIDIIEQKVKC